MNIIETKLPGVVIVEPRVFGDHRGFFKETYHEQRYQEAGISPTFVQDNFSRSSRGVLRGLHFQKTKPQGKLIQCLRGEIYDVIVDIDPASSTYGSYVGVELDDTNHRQVYIPPGYAHGFCVLSEIADISYKCTDFYFPEDEGGLIWNDPDVAIDWPIKDPQLSAKDQVYPTLKELKFMKILVIGFKGQVGTCLMENGPSYGFEMCGRDLPEIDITSLESVSQNIEELQPDLVINAAAYTAVDKAEEDQETAYRVNDKGTENIAAAAAERDVPFFHISTDYVFDGTAGPYFEEDQVNPLSVYGASKLAGEISLKNTWEKHVILRTCWLFSEHGNNFLKTMVKLARSRDELGIVGDQFGAPTSANHVALALLNLAVSYEAGKNVFGTYHFSGQPYGSWYDFAKVIFAEAEKTALIDKQPLVKSIATEEYPVPAPRPRNSRLECSKIMSLYPGLKNEWQQEVVRCLEILKKEGF